MSRTGLILAATGLFLGFLSSVILAISLNGLIHALKLYATAHDIIIRSQLGGDAAVPVFTGLDKHMDRGRRRSSCLTILGFLMMAASFALQLCALFLG